VLFDEGHGQRFLMDGIGLLHLSNLAGLMREEGLDVRSTKELLTPNSLSKAAALIISGAFQPLVPEEIAAVRAFLRDGGRLVIMLHIGPPVASLLHQLGVAISNGVIQERENVLDQPINFQVDKIEPHPVTQNLESFSIYGGWAMLPMAEPARSLAESSANAWVDLNGNRELNEGDAVQSFSVVVTGTHGDGEFLVFADDAMFQNRFLEGENRRLAENLARWLATTGTDSRETTPSDSEIADIGTAGTETGRFNLLATSTSNRRTDGRRGDRRAGAEARPYRGVNRPTSPSLPGRVVTDPRCESIL